MTRVWFADTTPLDEDARFEYFYRCSSSHRRQKADQYRFRKDRNLCIGAGALLDCGLKELGLRETDMHYGVKENGKPIFLNEPAIHFNLSHSGSKVMAVLSDGEVGCDVEQMRDLKPELAQRFFHEEEYRAIFMLASPESRREMFYRLWTLKESFIKTLGAGLSISMSDFKFQMEKDPITVIQSIDETPYSFREFNQIDGYKSALCSENELAELQVLQADFCQIIP